MYATVVLAFLIGLASAYLAFLRGRNPYIWFAIGLMFGMIGLLFLFILPSHSEKLKISLNKEIGSVDIEKEDIYQEIEWYYLDKKHEQQETLSFLELKESWDKGKINRETYVWSDGMEEWQKICEIPKLEKLILSAKKNKVSE